MTVRCLSLTPGLGCIITRSAIYTRHWNNNSCFYSTTSDIATVYSMSEKIEGSSQNIKTINCSEPEFHSCNVIGRVRAAAGWLKPRRPHNLSSNLESLILVSLPVRCVTLGTRLLYSILRPSGPAQSSKGCFINGTL